MGFSRCIRSLVVLVCCCFCLSQQAAAQCPALYDFFGTPSNNPYWYSCNGTDYTLNIQSPDNIGNWSIDWGDGSPVEFGASLVLPGSISHLYSATVDTFDVVFTEIGTGCVINGVFVMEEATSASIQIPVGGLTQACAPASLDFINSSTNTSETTVFTWDFGDGSPVEIYDWTNIGATVSHTYEQGTVDCETQVRLTAENYCNTVQGGASAAIFQPIRIWDIDDAAIDASATLLCYPDTTVVLTNVSDRNCYLQGNIAQRYEKWNFGDYWGKGTDSIVDWTPWPPALPYTLEYPGIGTYTATLMDSNFCGIDTVTITINIVPPPTAAFGISQDTICEGSSITFTNNAGGGANNYQWNFGEGAGWQATGAGDQTHTYNTAGDYTVGFAVGIVGGTGCFDTIYQDIHIRTSPTAGINLTPASGCDSVTVTFTDNSTGASQWSWDFDNGNNSNLEDPPTQFYGAVGDYTVTLDVEGPNGCTNSTTTLVEVHEVPTVDFSPKNVCEDVLSSFNNLSATAVDPIISYFWEFGDGNTATAEDPTHVYTNSGPFEVILTANTAHCSAKDTLTVVVEPKPTAVFTSDVTNGCTPLEVTYTNTSIGANAYHWDFGNGDTSIQDNPVYTFYNYGVADSTYTTTLIVTSTFGCTDTATTDITVFPASQSLFTHDAVPGCAPVDVSFTNTSSGAVSYTWYFGDGNTSISSDPNHTYTNLTQFIEIYDVSLVVESANGCTDSSSQQVTVYPIPDFGFSASPDSGCSPLSVSFPSVVGAVSYEWDFGDGNTSTGATPTHVFSNGTTNDLTFTVELIATSPFGCKDTNYNDVVVHPKPLADIATPDILGCSPYLVEITNNSTGADFYDWDYGDGQTSTTNVAIHQHTYQNLNSVTETYDIELIVGTLDDCYDTTSVSVQVYPEVDAVFTSDTAGCSALDVSFTNASVNGNSYVWDLGDGNTSIATNPSHQYINNTTDTSFYTVQLKTSSIFGCVDSVEREIQVYHKPAVNVSPDVLNGCSPLTVEFTNTSTGVDTYAWDYGDGNTSTTSALLHQVVYAHQSALSQQYDLNLIVSTIEGCKDTVDIQFDVYPEVHASFVSDTAGCSALQVDFTNTSLHADVYQWDFGDGDVSIASGPSHVFTNTTTDTLHFTTRLIASSVLGCRDTAEKIIDVFHKPVALVTPDVTAGCSPLTASLINGSTGADLYDWNYGNGQTSNTASGTHQVQFEHQSALTQNYTVTLLVTTDEGCRDTTNFAVDVYPEVHAGFLSDTAGCSALTISYTNTSLHADAYQWDFGDGGASLAVSPSHVYINNSTDTVQYTTRLISSSVLGCRDTAERVIDVYHKPVASFLSSGSNGCSPLTLELTNTSSGGDTYLWDYGNGVTSDTNVLVHELLYEHQSIVNQDYTLSLLVETDAGCKDTVETSIQVFAEVQAEFLVDTAGCSALDLLFINTSQSADAYVWDFGDGGTSLEEDPVHLYTNNTTDTLFFTAQLAASSIYGCRDTVTKNITVFHKPVASFFLDGSDGCSPLTLEATNTSSGASTYLWNYGNGQTPDTSAVMHELFYEHQSATTQQYQLELLVETDAGCKDTVQTQVEVYPEVHAGFTVDSAGCSALSLSYLNTTQHADAYQWDFGDGGSSVLQHPGHTFFNNTTDTLTFQTTLIANSILGCADTAYQYIDVYHKPVAQFTSDETDGCSPFTTALTNLSTGADYYVWDYGNGTGSDTTLNQHDITWEHQSSLPQGYTVELLVATEAGCLDTATVDLEVFPEVITRFDSDTVGCSAFSVDFSNFTLNADYYAWDFNDGQTSSLFAPGHVFINGTAVDQRFEVELIASSVFGCSDTLTREVLVHPKPDAGFSVNEDQGCTPFTVNIQDESFLADTYFWRYQAGVDTTLTNGNAQTYTYEHSSNDVQVYELLQIVETDHGCRDTASRDITVYPKVHARISSDTVGCSPLRVQFNNFSINAQSYSWDFGDGLSSIQGDPVHEFVNAGLDTRLYDTELIARSQYGCLDTVVWPIKVYHKPQASFVIDIQEACSPAEVTYTNLSLGASSFLWKYGDGLTGVDSVDEHAHTLVNGLSDPLDIRTELIVSTPHFCRDTAERTIRVFPKVIAGFTLDTVGCSPFDPGIINTTQNASFYTWNLGDGTTSSAQYPQHIYTYEGGVGTSYFVQLIGRSVYGCSDTIKKRISVFPEPRADFTVDPEVQTYPEATVTLDNQSGEGNWSYTWLLGDGTLIEEEEVGSYTYNSWGNYDIQLHVYNAFCADTAIRPIVIEPPIPVADFEVDARGCSPLFVNFTNKSEWGQTFFWDFGDGGTSNAENPNYAYFIPGSYSVSLRIQGPGGVDEIAFVDTVNVYPTADAYFSHEPKQVFVPSEPIVFFNLSSDADAYIWDFGNGDSSTLESPVYYYTEPGVFDVTLIANNAYNCADTAIVNQAVVAEVRGEIEFPNAFIPSTTASGDGTYDPKAIDNHIFFPVFSGVDDYHLMIFNRWGELIFETYDISIGWDGTYRGELCQQEVYVWKAEGRYIDGVRFSQAGDVTLIR